MLKKIRPFPWNVHRELANFGAKARKIKKEFKKSTWPVRREARLQRNLKKRVGIRARIGA
jgi:hypothetical protein